jgi:hypothetical protein
VDYDAFERDIWGNAVTSSNPTGGADAWSLKEEADQDSSMSGVSCTSKSLCVATDDAGNVATSTDPAKGSSSHWSVTPIPGMDFLTGIACASESICVADGGERVAVSNRPIDGEWHSSKVAGTEGMVGISCPSRSFCAIVDFDRAKLVTSTDPAGSAASWRPVKVPGARRFSDVSCASPTLCVGVGERGQAVVGVPGPPDTQVTDHRIRSGKRKARFRFRETHALATGFECRLKRRGSSGGGRPYRPCDSPKAYRHLRRDRYVFKVRAHNAEGVDSTPARQRFRIRG